MKKIITTVLGLILLIQCSFANYSSPNFCPKKCLTEKTTVKDIYTPHSCSDYIEYAYQETMNEASSMYGSRIPSRVGRKINKALENAESACSNVPLLRATTKIFLGSSVGAISVTVITKSKMGMLVGVIFGTLSIASHLFTEVYEDTNIIELFSNVFDNSSVSDSSTLKAKVGKENDDL
jgi:hypothetical protein